MPLPLPQIAKAFGRWKVRAASGADASAMPMSDVDAALT